MRDSEEYDQLKQMATEAAENFEYVKKYGLATILTSLFFAAASLITLMITSIFWLTAAAIAVLALSAIAIFVATSVVSFYGIQSSRKHSAIINNSSDRDKEDGRTLPYFRHSTKTEQDSSPQQPVTNQHNTISVVAQTEDNEPNTSKSKVDNKLIPLSKTPFNQPLLPTNPSSGQLCSYYGVFRETIGSHRYSDLLLCFNELTHLDIKHYYWLDDILAITGLTLSFYYAKQPFYQFILLNKMLMGFLNSSQQYLNLNQMLSVDFNIVAGLAIHLGLDYFSEEGYPCSMMFVLATLGQLATQTAFNAVLQNKRLQSAIQNYPHTLAVVTHCVRDIGHAIGSFLGFKFNQTIWSEPNSSSQDSNNHSGQDDSSYHHSNQHGQNNERSSHHKTYFKHSHKHQSTADQSRHKTTNNHPKVITLSKAELKLLEDANACRSNLGSCKKAALKGLGITSNKEARKAMKARLFYFHPDKCSDDRDTCQQQTQITNSAYSILKKYS